MIIEEIKAVNEPFDTADGESTEAKYYMTISTVKGKYKVEINLNAFQHLTNIDLECLQESE